MKKTEKELRFGKKSAVSIRQLKENRKNTLLNNGLQEWCFGEIKIVALNKKNAIKKILKIVQKNKITVHYFEQIKIKSTIYIDYFKQKIDLKRLIEKNIKSHV